MSTRTGYHLGRLLAALDRLGVVPNVERMYEKASIVPSHLTPLLMQATKNGGEEARELLLPIMAELPADAFEGSLIMSQQGDFSLGYYHQRAEFRAGRLPKLLDAEPELDSRYELRMDADLKAWVKANGGDKLIRALLRDARARHEA
jgi:hypothetical protein